MAYKVFDEVTADCLEIGDVILIDDASTSESVFLLVDIIEDETDHIEIHGRDVEDNDVEYSFSLDPDSALNLYMEVDDD